MEIYVFNRELNFIGILDNYISLRWRRRYFKCGEFELHCILSKENLNLLQKDNILMKKGDTEVGFIEFRKLTQDTTGKELLEIRGYFLTKYLNRRILWGTENINDTAENVIRALINSNCIGCEAPRVIPNLTLGVLKGYSQVINYQGAYKNLLNEIENILSASGLGFGINLNAQTKTLLFDIYQGTDRTIHQTQYPMVIFSKDYDNILKQEYTESLNNLRNCALIGGVGEGVDRVFATVGDSIGLDRYEVFVDAKNTSNIIDDIPLSENDYISLLVEKGKIQLAQLKEIETFNSIISPNSNLNYRQDFDLGDKVTCINKKWGIAIDTRITETEEVYEENGLKIELVFGNSIPTIIEKIKQERM